MLLGNGALNPSLFVRNRNLKLLTVAGLILSIGAVFWATHETDPVYQGKRLSRHLEAVKADGISAGHMSSGSLTMVLPGVRASWTDATGREAVQKVGTNALPMLVRMLRAKDGRFARHLWRIREGHPILKRVVPMKPPVSGFVNNVRALAALNELGPLAAPAIPKILPMLGDPDRAHVAIAAILSIQPELESDILSLTNVLRIKQTSISGASPSLRHSSAILALSTFGPKARGAIPVLLDCLHSTNGWVRGSAAIALARAGAPASKVVPSILTDLPKSNPPPYVPTIPPTAASWAQEQKRIEDWQNWQMDILALAEFGPRARAALPILSNLQSCPMINLRNAASEAAAIIQREDTRGKR